VSFDKKPNASGRASALLGPIEREARRHGYRRLSAKIQSTRANLLRQQGNYVESLAESDAALAEYEREHDLESVADTWMRRISVFRTAGQNELAWREGLRALQASSHLADSGARHLLLGDLAATARTLDHVQIALLYQNAALRVIQRALVATPPEQTTAIRKLQAHLGVVKRERAGIEVQLGQYDRAAADLNEAIRLNAKDMDPNAKQILQERIEEVRGQSLLRINPASAARAFSEALRLSSVERKTNRALLLAQRAEAQRLAGNDSGAEQDLRAALDALHAEELDILQQRKRGSGEEIWSAYFSRFPATYQTLIQQLLNKNRQDVAFNYAERQRAFEPLYLASEAAPNSFDGTPKSLAEIRQLLPPGALLIEYSFLGDHAVAWLVSRDFFQAVPLAMPSREIERRSAALQRAANIRNRTDFETQSYVLYGALIAEPIAKFGKMPDRLVIVPDGALHGLPFAALRNSNTRRYLIQDVPIEIAGSANLYLVSLTRDQALSTDAGSPSVLLIGDPAFNGNLALAHGLQPLPHARRECEKIAPLYPHAEILLEGDATIPAFLARARKSTVIHVAAHSIVNAQSPSRSFILFAPSANQPGPLDAQALLTALLPLEHARLVVLSTCSSAGGLPIGAEGVAPFVRPLIGAGVPAVVGTLWNVEDATAEDVLVSFHRHYREGSDAAVALQQAQVELLTNKNNNPGFKPVLAWAPFQVIGHGSSPFKAAPQQKEKPP
jgi:CHAT domain-containing protein